MACIRLLLTVCCLVVVAPPVTWGDPPSHAPAHGYRNKHKQHQRDHRGGFEVVFDSERGIHVVIGLPGVIVHAGKYYRHVEGSWQVSAQADAGWTAVAVGHVPSLVHKAHLGPAKLKVKHGK